MLDSQVVSYLQAGREARGLAIRLARLSRGIKRPTDVQAVRNAAELFSQIVAGKFRSHSAPSPSVALATAQGLGVAIHAAQQHSKSSARPEDPLARIADELSAIASHLQADNDVPKDIQSKAKCCEQFFENVREICQETIALDLDTTPPTGLERAMAEIPGG